MLRPNMGPLKTKHKVWCTRFPAQSARLCTSAKQRTITSGFVNTRLMCATSVKSAARWLNTENNDHRINFF